MTPIELHRLAGAIADWRPVPGYEQTYAVSSLGEVRSTPRPRTRGGVLTGSIDNHGYRRVALVQDGRQHTRRVHVLVALAFLGPCPAGNEIRHLNGDKLDCRVENLVYGTHAENMRDLAEHGTARRTHCKHGHLFDEANTTISSGKRYYRACMRRRWVPRSQRQARA